MPTRHRLLYYFFPSLKGHGGNDMHGLMILWAAKARSDFNIGVTGLGGMKIKI